MRAWVLLLVCVMIIYAVEGRKHHKKHKDGKDEKRSNHELKIKREKHEKHHGNHHHRNHHKMKLRHKETKKNKKRQNQGTIRQQVREFKEKLNSMLPKCSKKGHKCAEGTCCWKGRCKMIPHRVNQRCSVHCPCKDAKGSLYCHVKKGKNRRHKYGRCYIKGKSIGVTNVNFIPKTIEKFRGIEKKLDNKDQKHA